ncbi:MAG: ester cyclase [Pseudomonadota bacterium]
MRRIFIPVLAALTLVACAASVIATAGQKAVVEPFYAFLSNPTSDSHAAAARAAMADDWKSIGDYSGKAKTPEAFVGQIGGFGKLIPDMNWEMVEVIEAGDKVIVRGRATGTPQGPMFGVDGQGRGFDIMSIDIHTVKDGKIVDTHHVEDWAGALRQLSGQ